MVVFTGFAAAFKLLLISALLAPLVWIPPAQGQPHPGDAIMLVNAETGLEDLTISTASGRHVFSVEVMRTAAQRGRGLMERRYLPADRGMLFDFQEVQPVTMWMSNTYLPLDMLFIRKDGTIARIEEHTEPFSERLIPSGEPVLGVLELNAGTAARIGAKPGDRIAHPMFR
ncbi:MULTISPECIES: DUF192 domain-containing protein [unclassified Chelatococcus]|uniref:DUF192 domain-containing protein n=1 Tax=unclassified Chelatococcus TaxID=2638111 RepID=UPI001BCC8F2A|nr:MULTISPECIES: DUF192 domain-containing protein [unclassified Chelatococcus]MBS7698918.1 DUF192 domain-containing protein [Chelatococcus sp. YT9]MBX3559505.1 DUF192 domain-containing protein [Chelatococcus sp.]